MAKKISKAKGERISRDKAMSFLDECADILQNMTYSKGDGSGDLDVNPHGVEQRETFLDDLNIFRQQVWLHDEIHGVKGTGHYVQGQGYDKQEYADIKKRLKAKD